MEAIQERLSDNLFEVPKDDRQNIADRVKSKTMLAQSRPPKELKDPNGGHWGARSDAKVIAVYNFKGGVAKTTTAANLAASLAQGFTEAAVATRFEAKRVLMVDADAQANLTGYFVPQLDLDLSQLTGFQPPAGVQLAAHGQNPATVASHVPNGAHVKHMDHLLPNSVAHAAPVPEVMNPLSVLGINDLYTCLNGPMSGALEDLTPPEYLFKCHPHIYGDNLLLVPGSGCLFELDTFLLSANTAGGHQAQVHSVFSAWLHATARAVKADYVIVDLGPSANRFNQMVLTSCDYILPPAFADFFSLNSATHLLKTVLPSTIQLYDELLTNQNNDRHGIGIAGVQRAKRCALGLNVRPEFQPKLLPFLVTNYKAAGAAFPDGHPLSPPIIKQGFTASNMLEHLQANPMHSTAPKKLTSGPGKFLASMRNLVDNLHPDESVFMSRVIAMLKGDPSNAVPATPAGGAPNMYMQQSMVIPLIRTLPSLVADGQYFGIPMVSMTEAEWTRQDAGNPGLNQIIEMHPQDGVSKKTGVVLSQAVIDHLYVRGRFAQLCNLIESLPAP